MEATQERRRSAGQGRRRKLQRSVGVGRITLLVILAVSLLNQLLLLLKVDYYFLPSTAVPYYLNWLGQQIESGLLGFKIFAALAAVVIFGLYVVCWLLSARNWRWLRVSLILYCMDTMFLIAFSVAFLENPLSCVLWAIVHLIGVHFLYQAMRSGQQLEYRRERRAAEREAAAQ